MTGKSTINPGKKIRGNQPQTTKSYRQWNGPKFIKETEFLVENLSPPRKSP
jgi:hypothetical protein